MAFCSAANLTADDQNSGWDVYVRDLRTGLTTLESKSTLGACGNGNSGTDVTGIQMVAPSLSADGHFVAFFSEASNLVAADTNYVHDVFIRDRSNGTTTRVSVSTTGVQGDDESLVPVISADGRFVAFQSFASNLDGPDSHSYWDVFRHDCLTGRTTKLSLAPDGTEGDGDSGGDALVPSRGIAISSDGRWVAFESDATNLVSGGLTSFVGHVYLRDCATDQTFLVSTSAGGVEANGACRRPSISGDGRYVAFESSASNLVPGDANLARDVFVKDMATSAIQRASVSSSGAEGDAESWYASITPDGRHVGFFSLASNLDPLDGDTLAASYVHDLWTGVTRLVCLDSFSLKSNGQSGPAMLSADGSRVVFESSGTNLVLDDTHANMDVFVHDLPPRGASVVRTCSSSPNSTGQDALIDYSGTFRISSPDLELIAAHCPPAKLGRFFYGDAQCQVPFGAGWLCVDGSVHRLSPVQTDPSGHARFAFGPLLGSGASGIQQGKTYVFQFVFRDMVGAGPPDLNLTDAMSATFAP